MDLRLLGPVEAYIGDKSLALGGPRRRAVFATLLLKTDRAVAMEQLAQAIWEEPPPSAYANIRTHIANLRRALRTVGQGERLRSHGSTYRFSIESDELDVARFAGLADKGKQAMTEGDFETATSRFGEALALWRGRPLSGVASGPWLQTEIALLEEQWLAVVEQGIGAGLALGRHGDLIAELRELASEQESESQAAEALERAMCFYLAATQRAVTLLDPLRQWYRYPVHSGDTIEFQDRDEADRWLESQRAVLVAAAVQATDRLGGIAQLGIGLACALLWFLMPRLYVQDLVTVGQSAIRAARRTHDRAGEAWGLEMMGFAYGQTSRYNDAAAVTRSAHSIWLSMGDRDGEQRTLCNLANILRLLGNQAEAIALLNQQISIASELGNRVAEMIGMVNLGECYTKLGDYTLALDYLRTALKVARELNDECSFGPVLGYIGLAHLAQEEFSYARSCLAESLTYIRKLDDRESEASLLIPLSRACRALGDLETASVHCERGIALWREAGNHDAVAEALGERDRIRALLRAANGASPG